jgi:hypothetical protein
VSRSAGLLALAALFGCSGLTKVDGDLVAIEVTTPVSDTIAVGQTLQLTARALNAGGEAVSVPIVWRTPDATVSVDSATGLVTGVASGTGRVQAISGSLASELVVLTVVAPPVGP